MSCYRAAVSVKDNFAEIEVKVEIVIHVAITTRLFAIALLTPHISILLDNNYTFLAGTFIVSV